MKHIILLIYTFASIFLLSCSSDLKFTLPDVEPLIVVQSFVDPDRYNELIVTMARPLQDPIIQMSMDCLVDIYENDIFFKRLILDTSSFNNEINKKIFLRFPIDSTLLFYEETEYTVEVRYPGFEPVTARSTKPGSVKIKEISYRHFTGEMPDWYYNTPWKQYSDDLSGQIMRDTSLIEFTITIDDPAGIVNFYRVGVNLITNWIWGYWDRRIQYASYSDPDPCFMKFNYRTENPLYYGWSNPTTYEILWNDNNFNGDEHSIKIIVPSGSNPPPDGTKYIISLYSLSEDYYKYMVGRWKYFKTENDPFAEPIKFHSNASNNCGIFAFSSIDVDTVKFN